MQQPLQGFQNKHGTYVSSSGNIEIRHPDYDDYEDLLDIY
jgi:hypothetical protein